MAQRLLIHPHISPAVGTLHSPLPSGGEIDKVVGFPILSSRYRNKFRKLAFQDEVADPDLRNAIARRIASATLQPASTFMNAIRERISILERAGGRGSRVGSSYINGASYNPRVLGAILNIYRVYYNFFELRPYVSATNRDRETETVEMRLQSYQVPGSTQRVEVPQRRKKAPVERSPAMRLGVFQVDPKEKHPHWPDLSRVLYQPWLFYGTPLWTKMGGRWPSPPRDQNTEKRS